MLSPPIRNIGIEGMKKAAQMIPIWLGEVDPDSARRGLFNFFILIDATGGTGGGLFRYMFSRFLKESSEITGIRGLETCSSEFQHLGDKWQRIADIFLEGSQQGSSLAHRLRIGEALSEIANLENAAWMNLASHIGR